MLGPRLQQFLYHSLNHEVASFPQAELDPQYAGRYWSPTANNDNKRTPAYIQGIWADISLLQRSNRLRLYWFTPVSESCSVYTLMWNFPALGYSYIEPNCPNIFLFRFGWFSIIGLPNLSNNLLRINDISPILSQNFSDHEEDKTSDYCQCCVWF